nr:universal stress protein [Fibrobacterota bacterium]
MKVLIGYDGSPDSECALKELESSGLPPETQAIIFCAAPPWHPDHYALSVTGLTREATRFAEEALRQAGVHAANAAAHVRVSFPDWKVSSEAVMDSPAHGLMSKADAWKPDLIVLGCHGRTALGKLLMGSVSAKLLHYGHSDMRITRFTKKTASPHRVLLAVDGSPGSDNVVAAVASRAWPLGTRIRVLAALDGDGISKTLEGFMSSTYAQKGRDAKERWLKAKAESAAKRLSSLGWKAEAIFRKGDPRVVILTEARKWGADCIFLGSRGHSAISRFALG